MATRQPPAAPPSPPEAALRTVDAAFAALGRAVVCTGRDWHILHASSLLDAWLGPNAATSFAGESLDQVLGDDLVGPSAAFRQALETGERREGWRATLRGAAGVSQAVSVSGGPVSPEASAGCDPRVAFVVVLRPLDEEEAGAAEGPTLFAGLVARSASMLALFRMVQNLEHSDATVLLTGESGTGKELLARAIHLHSQRRTGPFVAVNCAGLPGELLESELFGHVRGAFTGAVRDRLGRFELAGRGTLFLDEIGDLPLPLQVKLLRVLQERTFERVGESQSRATGARVIAATNVDLRQAVATGRFREDLFYRLRVVPLEIPPLRSRREDIEPLAHALLAKVAARQGRALRFAPTALRALLRYPFPGNVRELENALEYAVAVARGHTIQPEDLPAEIQEASAVHPKGKAPPAQVSARDAEEGRSLRAALDACGWRREAAAKSLGMSRTTLWRKMREHGLA